MKLNIFPKVQEEFKVESKHGGVTSALTVLVLLLFFVSEINHFLTFSQTDEIEVDLNLNQRLPIHISITFHALTCMDVELVAMDVSGEVQMDVSGELHKHRLSMEGGPIGEKFGTEINRDKEALKGRRAAVQAKDYCGDCYGASFTPKQCCNTCADVVDGYRKRGWDVHKAQTLTEQCLLEMDHPEIKIQDHEGCLLEGVIEVNKVAGNIHVALGTSNQINGVLVHQFEPSQMGHFNTSHTINSFSFGSHSFEGQNNPLEGISKIIDHSQTGAYQYFLSIVPTRINNNEGANQYTFSSKFVAIGEVEHLKHQPHQGKGHDHPGSIAALPGVFFIYELSPFVVSRSTNRVEGWLDLVTNLLGISGGVVVVGRCVDALVFRFLERKDKDRRN